MLNAGDLIHRVTIQARTDVQNPSTGLITPSWSVFLANEPAKIEPLSVREFIAAQVQQRQLVARITINFREGITNRHRVLHGSLVYDIEGVLPDPDTGREYLTLACTEGLTDGE